MASLAGLDRTVEQVRVLRSDGLPSLIADSPAMKVLTARLERVAQSPGHVLVTGERGVGKEMVARWLHVLSPRSRGPLVAVRGGQCAVDTIESTLFGHSNGKQRGATERSAAAIIPSCLELATGGTLVLDGVGGLDADQQVRLAEILTTGRVPRPDGRARVLDVRIVATTHADPEAWIAQGRLQQALFDVLAGERLAVPPLRERIQDIPLLAMLFLKQGADRHGKELQGFDSDAMGAMLRHDWPGNVRELEHAVERAVLRAVGDDDGARLADIGLPPNGDDAAAFEQMKLSEVERVLIQKALVRHSGNVSRAARCLGLSRSALYRRLHRHNL